MIMAIDISLILNSIHRPDKIFGASLRGMHGGIWLPSIGRIDESTVLVRSWWLVSRNSWFRWHSESESLCIVSPKNHGEPFYIWLTAILIAFGICFVFYSWTDSRNHPHSEQCVIFYGQIHWKISVTRKTLIFSHTIRSEDVHTSTG